MRHLKRIALLVLPFVAVLGLSGVANATPTHVDGSTVASSRTAALAEAESFAAHFKVDATATYTNFVSNAWTGGLGVIHVQDGSYTYGTYDAVLPASDDTFDTFGWSTTAGWYNGPGRCSSMLRSDDGGNSWTQQFPDLGPGQHFIGAYTSYIVATYVC
ncbi:MAG TPA: hypothetical protein VJ914_22540 [Pseudonocardiaceae bacterium]|nr:hypothetical protein [Pseudonocardiaceae bacterium]